MSDKLLPNGRIIRDGVEYGCHCDLEEDGEPDGCVIDYGAYTDCIYGTYKNGRERTTQWTCKFWKPVCPPTPQDRR